MDYLAIDKPSEAYDKVKLTLRSDGSGEVKMGMFPVKSKFHWHVEDGEMVGISKDMNAAFGAEDIGNGEIKLMWASSMSPKPNFAYYMRRA